MLLLVNTLTLLYLIMGIMAQFVTTLVSIVISYPGCTVILILILILPIIKLVNPSHPPFRVCFLFRQVRQRYGITENVDEIYDPNERIVLNIIPRIISAVNRSKRKL